MFKLVKLRAVAVSVCLVVLCGTAVAQTGGPRIPPGLDGEFFELAGQLPGFGGYFFDSNGDLNIYLTDLSEEAAARNMFAAVAAERPQRWSQPWTQPAQIIVHKGDFDFVQLTTIKAVVEAAAVSVDGVQWFDANEALDRVVIGVSSEEAKAAVLSRLAGLTIPDGAVVVEVVPAISVATTLNDSFRPLIGGLQIDFNSEHCTLGVNVWYTNTAQNIPVGTEGFYTASHCSATQALTDGTLYYQGGAYIGKELYDPPFFTNSDNSVCAAQFNCRWSDVTFVAYDSTVTANVLHGGIARTTTSAVGDNTTSNQPAPSRIIDSVTPTMTITNGVTPVSGLELHKMGEASGWTYGAVFTNPGGTCFDVITQRIPQNIEILCADHVNAYATNGDSGAPVFQVLNTGDLAFAGIVFATDNNGGYFLSNTTQIAKDMGSGVNYLSH